MRSPAAIVAVVLAPGLLSACSGPLDGDGTPSGIAQDCLAMPSGDGQGWTDLNEPVADLLKPFVSQGAHQSWKTPTSGVYILRVERIDHLTPKVMKAALEFKETDPHSSKICGPRRIGVSRILADGVETTGWDLINAIPELTASAQEEREKQAGPHAPTPIQHVPPISVDPTQYGMLRDAHTVQPTPTTQTQNAAHSDYSDPNSRQLDLGPAQHMVVGQKTSLGGATLSATYGTCMASGDAAKGVTDGLLDCAAAETARQDARLNQAYKAKMKTLPPDQQQALRWSERDWIKSRDATCKDASSGDAGGSLAGVIYAQCIVKQEAQRAAVIESSK